jgi:hypothetical protein
MSVDHPIAVQYGFTQKDLEWLETAGIELDEVPVVIQPIFIGPTWEKDAFGRWVLPKRTLGWQIAEWCAKYLRGEDDKPWQFTLEQLRFVLWWYAVDSDGEFVYRTGVLQRMKGWGKDPLLAVLCLVELVGPSRFSHWDEKGNPVAKRHPRAWVQVTAVNQSQTTNTMALIPSLMSDELIAEYGIEAGAELIRAMNKTVRLEAVTSSYRALEGKRTTFTLLNETHHWVLGNNGHKMFETIDGNATKQNSRYLSITNAYLPGEDSVAERQRYAYEAIAEGRSEDIGLLYDTVEAHPRAPLTGPLLPLVIENIRGDAVWLKPEPIMQSILNPQIPPSRSRRMWLNQIVAEEDSLHGPETWDVLRDESLELLAGDRVVLGFDGGKTDDATALVAIRVGDRAVFVLGCWEAPERGPDDPKWEVDRAAVDSAIHEAFSTYDVAGFYADVALWESYIDSWATTYGDRLDTKASQLHPIAWDMRSSLQRSTRAHERLLSAIFDKTIRHDGNRSLRRHVLNTKRAENNHGVSFRKESRESKRKVDLYAAMMLAHEALTDLLVKGAQKKTEKPKTRRGYFM